MSDDPVIDWSVHEKYERSTLACACGAVYLSHYKFLKHQGRLVGVSKDPCPACGKNIDNIRRAESPPERWTIGG